MSFNPICKPALDRDIRIGFVILLSLESFM